MLRPLLIVALESLKLLRRDRLFGPVLAAGVALTLFANLASTWGIADFPKILFDVGYFSLQILGSLVALFWAAKSVSDARQDGALELRLAAPLSRSAWLLGRYLGLVIALLLLSVLLLVVWQLGMLGGGFGWLQEGQIAAYGFMVLGWLVLAAMALCLGVLMRFSVALFTSVGAWVAGLASSLVAQALGPQTTPAVRLAARAVARVWDLQQFNLLDRLFETPFLSLHQAAYRLAYGAVLIALMLTMATLAVSRGDAFA